MFSLKLVQFLIVNSIVYSCYIYHRRKEGNLRLLFHSSQSLDSVTQYKLTATATITNKHISYIYNIYILIKSILQGNITVDRQYNSIYVSNKIQIHNVSTKAFQSLLQFCSPVFDFGISKNPTDVL